MDNRPGMHLDHPLRIYIKSIRRDKILAELKKTKYLKKKKNPVIEAINNKYSIQMKRLKGDCSSTGQRAN